MSRAPSSAQALDGGDPKTKVADGAHRDRVLLLPAPFDAPPHELLRTRTRYRHADWGADGSALLWERWYHTRRTIVTRLSHTGEASRYLEYDFSDAYGHPGSPLLEEGASRHLTTL